MSKALDLRGKMFGRLTIIERVANSKAGKARWLCKCSCGNTTTVVSSHLNTGIIKSCGCLKDEATQERATQRQLEWAVEFTCKHCKETTTIKKSKAKNRIFCSKKCYEASRFTGLTLPENRAMRQAPEYRDWRKAVFIRDYYTCKKCSTKGGELRAHHLSSFSRDKKNRFNIDNGVTLCKGCHNKFHKLYGILGFTPKQFYKWVA